MTDFSSRYEALCERQPGCRAKMTDYHGTFSLYARDSMQTWVWVNDASGEGGIYTGEYPGEANAVAHATLAMLRWLAQLRPGRSVTIHANGLVAISGRLASTTIQGVDALECCEKFAKDAGDA